MSKTLERLAKLIELATDADTEESRNAAWMACKLIKREKLVIIEPNAESDHAEWAQQITAIAVPCADCELEIEEGQSCFVNRHDGRRVHQGCIP